MMFGDENWGRINCKLISVKMACKCRECEGHGWEGCPRSDVEEKLNGFAIKRGAVLEGEFRLIISHRMMGCDTDMDKEEFDGMINDLVKAAV